MVCCMFEEAASLAASVVERIRTTTLTKALEDSQLAEIMESAGMVFVQSLKELGRSENFLLIVCHHFMGAQLHLALVLYCPIDEYT